MSGVKQYNRNSAQSNFIYEKCLNDETKKPT